MCSHCSPDDLSTHWERTVTAYPYEREPIRAGIAAALGLDATRTARIEAALHRVLRAPPDMTESERADLFVEALKEEA